MMFFAGMESKVPIAMFASWGRGHILYTYDLKNWLQQAIFANPTLNFFYTGAYDPSTNRVVLATDQTPGVWASTPSGVIGYYSGRNGGNWARMSAGIGSTSWATMANGSIFFGTTTYVYKIEPLTGTTTRYTVVSSGSVRETVYDSVSGKYCITVGGTTYHTSDFSSFTSSALGFGTSPVANTIFNGPAGRIVAAGNTSGSVGKVSTSDDGGVTWTNRTLPSPSGGGSSIIYRGAYVSQLGMYFLGSASGVTYYSYDGVTWTQGSTLGSSIIRGIAYSPSLKLVYMVDSLLNTWISTDGLSWKNMNVNKHRFATASFDATRGMIAIR
jgi:hypothetical protein